MVLESLESVKDVVKSPWHLAIFSAVVSLISLGVSYLVFPDNAGLLSVFLITIVSSPFMLSLMRFEEDREEKELKSAKSIFYKINPFSAFQRQSQTFVIYSAFFVGVVLAMSVMFVMLPSDFVSKIFNDQISQIGKISTVLGGATASLDFGQILANNLVVMSVAFIFALLFGLGAVFILAWNASVLSAAIGIVVKGSGIPTALVTFLPHGVFEIAAYFVAAIAGGIISVAVSKRGTKEFRSVVEDMSVLMVLSVILVAIGAYVESS